MEAVWLIIGVCLVIAVVLLIVEISGWQVERSIAKMRLDDERKADEERQLVEKIRSIAKAVCVNDRAVVMALLNTMKGMEK